MGYVYVLFLGTFTKPLRKVTAGHVVSVHSKQQNFCATNFRGFLRLGQICRHIPMKLGRK